MPRTIRESTGTLLREGWKEGCSKLKRYELIFPLTLVGRFFYFVMVRMITYLLISDSINIWRLLKIRYEIHLESFPLFF